MKNFRELYFTGTEENLKKFADEIKQRTFSDWKVVNPSKQLGDYLMFDYVGKKLEPARVSIHLGDSLSGGKIQVGNIIPLEKSKLSIDEYNAILMEFYNDVIFPYKNSYNRYIDISGPTNDTFDPLSVISKEALQKLKLFCNAANKSTGSSHPCDQERWFEFICQTVDDEKMMDYTTLAKFLSDENYWGFKEEGFIGVIGGFAWDEETSYELASEYESLCQIVMYYKNKKGL